MNYREAFNYIKEEKFQKSKPGLERTQELLFKCGNPEKKLKYIHIAGTNGKGSVAAMLSSILCESGYKTGLFTSPYLVNFNEQVRINNDPVFENMLADVLTDMKEHIEEMQDTPTEFEIITAAAFNCFCKEGCDIVILEVGMGGLHDSTNIIETPELSVITSIGLDHRKELGNTIEEITLVKSGIIKNRSDVIFYGEDIQAIKVIEEVCKNKDADLYIPNYTELTEKSCNLDGISFDYKYHKDINVPLIGKHQFKNAAVSIEVCENLIKKGWDITENSIKAGLGKTVWPGRFEIINRDPLFITDGAHNCQGVKAFTETLKYIFQGRKFVFILGVMADKDVKNIIEELIPLAVKFITVTPENPRAMNSKELANIISTYDIQVTAFEDVKDGIKEALIQDEGNIICAVGSLYMYKSLI